MIKRMDTSIPPLFGYLQSPPEGLASGFCWRTVGVRSAPRLARVGQRELAGFTSTTTSSGHLSKPERNHMKR